MRTCLSLCREIAPEPLRVRSWDMANFVSGPQATHLEAELAGGSLSGAENPWHIFHFLFYFIFYFWCPQGMGLFPCVGTGQVECHSPSQLQDQDIWSSASSPSAQMGNGT